MVKYSHPTRIYLTIPELESFWDSTMKLTGIERLCGLYFLRQCYSSLRISDNKRIECDSNWIVLKSQKTGKEIRVPIKNKLKQIHSLIKGELKISDPHYNRYIRAIAGEAGIFKHITSHSGRHTFGYLCAKYGIPPHITQAVMGHSRIETTMIYYHLEDEIISREMDKFN